MATPDPSHPLDHAAIMARLEAVEDSVHEIEFLHMVKVDAVTNGLSIVHGQVRRLEHELTGFRGEATAHLEALTTGQAAQGAKLDSLDAKVDEILRRLPPPADQ